MGWSHPLKVLLFFGVNSGEIIFFKYFDQQKS